MKQELKKNRQWLPVAALLLVLIATVFIMTMKKESAQEAPQTEPAETVTETSQAQNEPMEVVPVVREYIVVELVAGQIKTPYGMLNYPDELSDHLLIINRSQEPYSLEFYAVMEGKHEVRLFDISLGEGSGGNMGVVKTEQGEIPLNVVIYSLSFDNNWMEGEIITAQAMQDVVNDMIEQMAPQAQNAQTSSPTVKQQPVIVDTVNNMEIMTPYCFLYYPARWSNTLNYVHDDAQEDVYKVCFYGETEGQEDQLLFSIYFGGDEGEQLGDVMGADGVPVSVNLLMSELDMTGLAEENAERMLSMQEAVNQLIEKIPFLK